MLEKNVASSIVEAAARYGTPFYIYFKDKLEFNIAAYKRCFSGIDITFCYALKANSNKCILKTIAQKGFGADVVSLGELMQALSCGFKPQKIIFSGVGKTSDELFFAVGKNIKFINVESFEELKKLSEIALLKKRRVYFSIRINPNVDPHTHKYISTGKYGSKFGVSLKEAFEMYKWAKKNNFLIPAAVHYHLGSQIFSSKPYIKAFYRVETLLPKLWDIGIKIDTIDLGGGWGIKEGKDLEPPREIASFLRSKKWNYKFIMEPGRSIVASCGFFVVKTLYRKKSGGRNIVIVDGGMNDFIRPSLYGATHPVFNITANGQTNKKLFDIYGPVCESGDFLTKNVKINVPGKGDLLCFVSAGAYGYSMSSNYNLRRKPAEIMVSGRKIQVIRKRQEYKDFIDF